MLRAIVRATLIIAGIIAVAAIIATLSLVGPGSTETWAVIAAALAVITSVISSWPAQRVLELQQDAQQPYPYPAIDVKSRYGLMQLRVTNSGGSAAHDISLRWDKPLLNTQGELVRFTKHAGAPEIPVLLPGESAAMLVGGSHALYEKYQDMNYSGEVEFRDASGTRIKHPFHLSAEAYRSTLVHDQEEPKTHYELQKIPDELQKLRTEVRQLRVMLQQSLDTDEEPE